MADRKPWFLVMTPEDANRAGSEWVRIGAASRGKVVARPIAREGWLVLMAFAVVLTIAPLTIWLALFLTGVLSLIGAIVCTIVAVAAIVTGFVLLVQSRMTRLPPGIA